MKYPILYILSMIITDGFTSGYIAAKKNRRIKLNHGNQTTKKYQPTNIYIYIYILNIVLYNVYITSILPYAVIYILNPSFMIGHKISLIQFIE